jgi:hypothetical protein
MKHFDKRVMDTVQNDIEAIKQVGSMYGLIEWWAVTDNEGTGVSGRDQWQFVTKSYPKFVEWALKRWLEGDAHPMHDDRRVHWRDIDDRDLMEEYIEEMGGINNI